MRAQTREYSEQNDGNDDKYDHRAGRATAASTARAVIAVVRIIGKRHQWADRLAAGAKGGLDLRRIEKFTPKEFDLGLGEFDADALFQAVRLDIAHAIADMRFPGQFP